MPLFAPTTECPCLPQPQNALVCPNNRMPLFAPTTECPCLPQPQLLDMLQPRGFKLYHNSSDMWGANTEFMKYTEANCQTVVRASTFKTMLVCPLDQCPCLPQQQNTLVYPNDTRLPSTNLPMPLFAPTTEYPCLPQRYSSTL